MDGASEEGQLTEDESASLERLYRALREAHADLERAMAHTSVCQAQLSFAQRELDKAKALESKIKVKTDDIDLAILDRRRAERGGGVTT